MQALEVARMSIDFQPNRAPEQRSVSWGKALGPRTSHLFFLNLQLEQTIFRFLLCGTVPGAGSILTEMLSNETMRLR